MVRLLGAENLRTFSPKGLEGVRLPDSSKGFLLHVGLPRAMDELMLTFDFDADHMPTLAEYAASRGYRAPEGRGHLRRIGTDYGTQLCLDENNNGVVVGIDIEGLGIRERFMNSSVEQLGAFLAVYRSYRGSGAGMGEEQLRQIALKQEGDLRKIDPEALIDDGRHWWAEVMEQVKDNLL